MRAGREWPGGHRPTAVKSKTLIPAIDLFAGPGGLGEGFAADGFDIRLSIEKEAIAHRTLELRAFFRRFPKGDAPEAYYEHLRGERSRDELFTAFPDEAAHARNEAWCVELGLNKPGDIRARIKKALGGDDPWVLIGGPPCQAYSLVGRSRNKGIEGYTLEGDPRARLYREYLRVIADFWPAAFVMENVRGLLSSKLGDKAVFDLIREDLREPAGIIKDRVPRKAHTYTLHALAPESLYGDEPRDFLVKCELFGVPQARHRVIIVGVRDDMDATKLPKLSPAALVSVEEALKNLPVLRSGISKEEDSAAAWTDVILEFCRSPRVKKYPAEIRTRLEQHCRQKLVMQSLTRGGEFMASKAVPGFAKEWMHDPKLRGVCNHATRSHIREDLFRYLFAAIWTEVNGRSPHLGEFPEELLPAHANAAGEGAPFADRFRVQPAGRPSKTVTSHISKDGHYYIHYAPEQCRSLTVREAARLQTFPDNYFFAGARTQQYIQVGSRQKRDARWPSRTCGPAINC